MGRRFLLTGATGLIGTQVSAAWQPRHGDLLPSSPSIDGIDLLAPGGAEQLLQHYRPDAVVHLAWCASGRSDYRHSDDNRRWLRATVELERACRAQNVDLALTGTPLDSAGAPGDAYSAAKSELLRIFTEDVRAGRLTWLRPFYVFDPDAGRPRLVEQAVAARTAGSVLTLETPAVQQDFIHAADVGSGIALALAEGLTGPVDIATGRLRRVDALVHCLGVQTRAANQTVGSRFQAGVPADPSALLGLGWRPTRTEEFFHDG